jgi:asparagine synthase (glutamine-hydrolysing)
MCGIAGLLAGTASLEAQSLSHVRAMCDAIAHRGPDDAGSWSDLDAGIVLGHRRLAIVDLSPQGHQPMQSHCGRYELIFNGEIYNHQQLRAGLQVPHWRGHSDTETLLALFSRHGVIGTLPLLVGMFAFAVWDRQDSELTLVRDRMGEKPLYWCRLSDGSYAFGSELRALRAHPKWRGEIDRDALTLLMRHNCIPAPYTIYKDVEKLEPASWITLSRNAEPQRGRYWDLASVAQRRSDDPSTLDDGAATDRLEALLAESVSGQMLSDVPLGAFLSGGVDSSAIVAMMARVSATPVKTFCIGFTEGGASEAVHARTVARHLGTDHFELDVSGADALAVVPRLASIYDEPFADSSQIPTFLVSQLARQNVTVALSGDAGDELFAGYNRYLIAARLWGRMSRVPLRLRRACASGLLAVPPKAWDLALALPQRLRPASKRHNNPGDKLHKLARRVLPARDVQTMYRSLTSHWSEPEELVLDATEPTSRVSGLDLSALWHDPLNGMSLADQLSYLPDDILVKVDRAAMAVSLETRAPFLDHRLVEFAWGLPQRQKIRDGQSKWLLRQVLYRHVPRELIDRPKQGFAVPLDRWLRGPLRDWAEDLLDQERLECEGYLAANTVRQAWTEHLSGRQNRQHELWNVLMFQAWLKEYAA